MNKLTEKAQEAIATAQRDAEQRHHTQLEPEHLVAALVKQAAVDYQNAHPDVKISVAGGGSRVGITQVAQRAVDIGDSDIPAPNQPSLVDHLVAVVTFGMRAFWSLFG